MCTLLHATIIHTSVGQAASAYFVVFPELLLMEAVPGCLLLRKHLATDSDKV